MSPTETSRQCCARGLVLALFLFLYHGAAGQTAIVRNFDPATDTQNLPSLDFELPIDSGFVFGTNTFVDLAKATALTLPDGATEGTVEGVNVWFGFKRDGVTIENYTIAVYDGDATSGPASTPLYSESFSIAGANADADVSTDEIITEHTFAQPVTVGANYFVSVGFGTYGQEEYGGLAIVSSALRGARVPEDWELWLDGSWHNISDAWTSDDGSFGSGTEGWHMWVEAVVTSQMGTAIEAESGEVPEAFALSQNYPNPFTTSTTMRASLPQPADISVIVYDLLGREVETIASGRFAAGVYSVSWYDPDAPAGIYLARMSAGDFTQVVQLTRTP